MRRTCARDEGFSLIELLVIVAIILALAAFAIPSLLRSRSLANESSAVNTLRILYLAESRYTMLFQNSFSTDLNSLGRPPGGTPASATAADLVDDVLAARRGLSAVKFNKNGYIFTYTPSGTFPSIQKFTITADPESRGKTGQRSFFLDESGITRENRAATATVSDLPVK